MSSYVDSLLLRWDAARRRGHLLSPEELVGDATEYVEILRHRIHAIQATDWLESTRVSESGGDDSVEPTAQGNELPESEVSVDDFLRTLVELSLVDIHDVDRWREHSQDPRTIASYLIDFGVITKYQAGLLLAGSKSNVLLDKYLIVDVIDAGGMGIVYQAIHRPMNRIVALKMVAQHLLDSSEKKGRFLRELRIAASLTHPNIVAAYDADHHEDSHFLVMEFVDGPNLRDYVEASGPLPLEEALQMFRQAADALQFAHEQGVVHRDVKPANLLVTAERNIKVADMGLATWLVPQAVGRAEHLPLASDRRCVFDEWQTQADRLLGTVAFMAPEQAADVTLASHRADIYSLGCALYFALTGRSPFAGDHPQQVLAAHAQSERPRVSDFRPDVHSYVDEAVQKMMAVRPVDRYRTMKEVGFALEMLRKKEASRKQIVTPEVKEPVKRHWRGRQPLMKIALRCLVVIVSLSILTATAEVMSAPFYQPTRPTHSSERVGGIVTRSWAEVRDNYARWTKSDNSDSRPDKKTASNRSFGSLGQSSSVVPEPASSLLLVWLLPLWGIVRRTLRSR